MWRLVVSCALISLLGCAPGVTRLHPDDNVLSVSFQIQGGETQTFVAHPRPRGYVPDMARVSLPYANGGTGISVRPISPGSLPVAVVIYDIPGQMIVHVVDVTNGPPFPDGVPATGSVRPPYVAASAFFIDGLGARPSGRFLLQLATPEHTGWAILDPSKHALHAAPALKVATRDLQLQGPNDAEYQIVVVVRTLLHPNTLGLAVLTRADGTHIGFGFRSPVIPTDGYAGNYVARRGDSSV